MVLIRDALDDAIYSPRQLLTVTGEAPLIAIPYVHTSGDFMKQFAVLTIWSSFIIGGLFGSAVIVHGYWMPLDVLWYAAMRKFGI